MRNSKKGLTLIEIICGLAVLAVAVVIGTQLFSVGARAVGNSQALDTYTQQISRYFESAADTHLPPTVQRQTSEAEVQFSLDGVSDRAGLTVEQITLTDEANKVKSELRIAKNSIG